MRVAGASSWCGRMRVSCCSRRRSTRPPHDPGYIKGYLPGVRENGAQYTHAALWAVLATAMTGDGDRAFELFQLLNPLTHTRTPEERGDLPGRALRRRGRRVLGGGPGRARRVDLVHGLGELDVPRGAGGDPRVSPSGATASGWTPGCRPAGRSSASSTATEARSTRWWSSGPHAARGGAQEVVLDGRTLDGEWIELADDGARHTVVVRPLGSRDP